MKSISIIGAGLSGSEAALAAAQLGVQVHLYEMRPTKMTPAHHTGNFAELVCSNSLGGEGNTNAKGLLQAEIAHAGSLIMEAARESRVPAGGALAVAREGFSAYVTEKVRQHPLIQVYGEEVTKVPEGIVVLASGPLTSDALAEDLKRYTDGEHLSFYDAAAPVISFDSINMEIAYRKGRYDQEADYINCPMNREQYDHWYNTIQEARQHTPHDWEKLEFFEGCMPIEEIARRGKDTPRFGPMKPRGLHDPRTDREPYAVVQLRQEDQDGRMWSLVGFQTGLKWGDQKLMVQSIPGLEEADIVRYGVMHRNTYLCAPKVLNNTLQLKADPNVLVAGVLSGTEGYLESAATGWLAGTNAARLALGLEPVCPPEESMLGGLVRYLASANPKGFQPMNTNWALVPDFTIEGRKKIGKREKRPLMFERGLNAFKAWHAGLDQVTAGQI
ncbi:methylenetetrahydrofolate--tRNA-(uracil(54)-C(5))-methyltransferase (FADH(2)-oxidizing) TrmFO [Deinococcus cellulosilyticus]|uniref:Methylenetetrahydrofolate--tRNA-(uracil-5-)-methyltransferase TrmFO n=1 Tax=Deinococcus cellulosilyticus (strain DSM 18568 / NBRC 106333 / KACC 11606 / 5516J-15) TaxID=1223518 RepID=A0A511N580_DEIC1|nr:methylenetetrahydrofolate--tRNA-(uracil(54)-C(5))-methyltransferase (FADH(2)-oxidizing) TrmFO [Deinococcus cellulosilyticus]GEM48012.1 methylenetetrahydrofolate--tRNA-(uracil-5-)-methyltransferase TrmFO [Deinococcus cellulosilyticus NBRC 106333 = KACC 11606]